MVTPTVHPQVVWGAIWEIIYSDMWGKTGVPCVTNYFQFCGSGEISFGGVMQLIFSN